jgi:hypothetical protein
MPIHPLDLPELLRNVPSEINNLHTISDVTEQVVSLSSVRRGFYAWPWPDTIEGLGHLHVDFYAKCSDCPAWSWVRYGSTVLCLACAKRRRDER